MATEYTTDEDPGCVCVCECACVGGTERCTAAESTGSVGCERAGAEETVWEQAAGHGRQSRQTDRRKGVWRMETGQPASPGARLADTQPPTRGAPRGLSSRSKCCHSHPPASHPCHATLHGSPTNSAPPPRARCWLLSFTCATPTGLHSCLGMPLTFQTTTTQPHQPHAACAAAPEHAAAAFLRGRVNAGPCTLNS